MVYLGVCPILVQEGRDGAGQNIIYIAAHNSRFSAVLPTRGDAEGVDQRYSG